MERKTFRFSLSKEDAGLFFKKLRAHGFEKGKPQQIHSIYAGVYYVYGYWDDRGNRFSVTNKSSYVEIYADLEASDTPLASLEDSSDSTQTHTPEEDSP